MKIIALLLLLSGCGLQHQARLSKAENVIMTPAKATTEMGRDFAGKFQSEMTRIFTLLHLRYNSLESNFIFPEGLYGLGLYREARNPDSFYFGTRILAGGAYNTLRTNFNQRAATTFVKHGRVILQDLMTEPEILSYPKLTGIHFTLGWYARDFSVSNWIGGEAEGVGIFASIADCKAFLNNDITNQEFVRRAKIIGFQGNNDLGKIELSLTDIL